MDQFITMIELVLKTSTNLTLLQVELIVIFVISLLEDMRQQQDKIKKFYLMKTTTYGWT